ncbi:MAG: PIN domain-containing protein [Gemmatimonadetes bacterium]|nr:PIN domain-containing protein [Gemmatimonadota bacterium]
MLGRREPWVRDSAAVLSLIEASDAEGFVAAHTLTTLDCLLAKYLSPKKAASTLVSLLNLVRATSVDHETLLKAFSLGWTDFEDAVQAVCALQIGADFLVTRDAKAFSGLWIPVVSPSELLSILTKDQHAS